MIDRIGPFQPIENGKYHEACFLIDTKRDFRLFFEYEDVGGELPGKR